MISAMPRCKTLFPALAGVLLLSLASCSWMPGSSSHAPDKLELEPVSFHDIRGWDKDAQEEALGAFLKSCKAFNVQPETGATGQGALLAPVAIWKSVCRNAAVVPPNNVGEARTFFEQYFVPFRASNHGDATGLFTGYYEPLLKGSLTRHRPFAYPVYGLPPAGTPAYTRAQMDFNVLMGKAPVLAYVDDPVQLFFLHIQGSGRIQLEDGKVLHVGYAGSNGLPYVSIGKRLVEKGIMKKEDVSMPSLKQWLYDHPNDMWQVMWENTSYVFFRPIEGDPLGTQQVPLTPERSLAVDARYIPLGMPVFVDTILPPTELAGMAIHRKLLIAQDTGGAIRGPLRGDIFFGFGPEAEARAGMLRSGGTCYLLVPRALAKAVQDAPGA